MKEYISTVVGIAANNSVIRATKYVSPKVVVRAVRKRYGKRINKRGNVEIILTIGRPNYIEREFVKLCQKAKVPFPVREVQIKLYSPKKR